MTSNLTKLLLGTALAAGLVIGTTSASHAVVLNTSALPDGDAIGGFFNGQTDLSTGIKGPNLGITFSSDATNNVGFPNNPNATFASAPAGGANAITFGSGTGSINFANPFAYDVSFFYTSLFGGEVLVNLLNGQQETIDLLANNPDASSCPSTSDSNLSFCTWTDVNL
ncbi:MAG: hypothetical protein JO255_15240, partial [Alphaproteobacteria bacterium]|nr:hypothetical protein [Alphaproteobacteria bacterium]